VSASEAMCWARFDELVDGWPRGSGVVSHDKRVCATMKSWTDKRPNYDWINEGVARHVSVGWSCQEVGLLVRSIRRVPALAPPQ